MDGTIAAHLAGTDLTTLALFSVTNKRNGTLDTSQRGYRTITGPLGAQLIREAHDRGVLVEVVFTSFGATKNKQLFGAPLATQDKVIAGFVDLVDTVGADGVNVDVEQLGASLIPSYGAFVGRLREALRAAHPDARVSVATQANENGAAMAVAANANGADRIFLMGYDYHYAGSQPGASAPIDRRDGAVKDLVWSLDLYQALGVPVEKTLLGLPLYGIAWPVAGPEVGAPSTGKGTVWIPSDHLDVLHDPSLAPVRDEIEQVEVYTIPAGTAGSSAGSAGAAAASVAPSAAADPGASASPAVGAGGWQAIYVDSPATLTPKLLLADSRGLAGVGFWAIGYERGAPEYTELIGRFAAGQLR
jgi:spore germination protein YaaH